MRFVISILLILHFAAADDKSECLSMCKEKFVGSGAEKSACEAGCEARKSIAKDIFGFSLCGSDCVKMYSNETMDGDDEKSEEEEADNGELKACKFACSLPFEARYTMTLDMSGPKPKWNVQQESGSSASRSVFDQDDDAFKTLSNILLKPRVFSSSSNAENDFLINSKDIDMDSNQFLQNMVRRVMEDAQKQMEDMKKFGRPSGHGLLAFKGPEVGNQGFDGEPIIREFNVEEYQRFLDRNQQIHNQSIRWLFLTMAVLFLIISGLGIILFIRRPNIEKYTTIHHPPTVAQIPAKKSMISEDAESNWTQKEPEGEAPPAYDQVSVHKMPLNQTP